ncbi:MAG: SsrA-binding protein SmpB [bacterium]|nr:SsrA-binding protein SmpB [bacterium]
MAKKKKSTSGRIVNRRAKFDYQLEDSFVVGLQLTGKETKALRMNQGSLQGSYVTVKDGELWLINSLISDTKTFKIEDKTRTRKLLAKAKEIKQMIAKKEQGRTLVPLEFLTKSRYIKLRIAAGKGKREYDKRQTIKKREFDRKTADITR